MGNAGRPAVVLEMFGPLGMGGLHVHCISMRLVGFASSSSLSNSAGPELAGKLAQKLSWSLVCLCQPRLSIEQAEKYL